MFKRYILTTIILLFISNTAFCQEATNATSKGPRKQVATIMFAGLGGAILGLSTLSFYGRPQDHMNNIAMGFGLGLIAGSIYTSYKATTRPREFYGHDFLPDPTLTQEEVLDLANKKLIRSQARLINLQWTF